jgi:DNA-binding transcriptional LysR family regulator
MNSDTGPSIWDVDIRLLRVFRTVVECRGFTNAEPALNIGRSTISTHVSDLEGRLGIRLCERGPAGFSLTEQGHDVYRATLGLLATLEAFSSEIGTIKGQISGEINLGIIDNTLTDTKSPLIGAIDRFRGLTEQVHLRVHMLSADDIEQRIMDGRIHLGIMSRHGDYPGINYETLYNETSVLCYGREHPLFDMNPKDISPQHLKEYPYITHGYAERIKHHTKALGFKAAGTAYSLEAVAMFILTGKFIGFLPDHYAAIWTAQGKMGRVHPDTLSYESEIALAVRKGARKTLAMQALISELKTGCGLLKKK